MSKNSHKQLYTQLMEWMPTVIKHNKRRVKSKAFNRSKTRG